VSHGVRYQSIGTPRRLGPVVVSVLPTGHKGFGFEPGQGDGFLRAIRIRSTPSSRMRSKAGRSHVVRFYGMLKNSRSPTGTDRLNSHFLRPSPAAPEISLVTARSALEDKLGVRPSRSCLLTGPHRCHPGIVQQAQGRSAETAVSPRHNNQRIIYNRCSTFTPVSSGRCTMEPLETARRLWLTASQQ
jgi:hypothetical protein